jgi:hypothetical protein
MAVYRYLAHDLRTNSQLAELPLSNVRFGEILNGAGSFSATLPLACPRRDQCDSDSVGGAAAHLELDP